MGDNPAKTVKWMARQLLEEERSDYSEDLSEDTADLLTRVDQLLEDIQEPEPPAFAQKRTKKTKGQRAEEAHVYQQFDESAAVLTKTRRQLRQEAKQRKKAEKNAKVNRNIKDLVFLAILELLGILAILGWWLQ